MAKVGGTNVSPGGVNQTIFPTDPSHPPQIIPNFPESPGYTQNPNTKGGKVVGGQKGLTS